MSGRSYCGKYYLLSDPKILATLNSIGVLLTGFLNDLCAHNFMDAKTSLRARCVHARNRACNLLSPGQWLFTRLIYLTWNNTRICRTRWTYSRVALRFLSLHHAITLPNYLWFLFIQFFAAAAWQLFCLDYWVNTFLVSLSFLKKT